MGKKTRRYKIKKDKTGNNFWMKERKKKKEKNREKIQEINNNCVI